MQLRKHCRQAENSFLGEWLQFRQMAGFWIDGVQMNNIKSEIARVEKVIAETKSPYLKKDYEKYLKKLRNKQKQRIIGTNSNC